MLRRLVALILMLCLGLFTAESLLADVHDGDATHEELVRVDGERHAEQHSSATADTEQVPDERDPGEQGHSLHACHCVHAHVIWSPVQSSPLTAAVIVEEDQAALSALGPTSPVLEAHLRPPIA